MNFIDALKDVEKAVAYTPLDQPTARVHRESLETVLAELNRLRSLLFEMRVASADFQFAARKANERFAELNTLLDRTEPNRP